MDWLADLDIRWVLVGVGALVAVLASLRLTGARGGGALWLAENVQVLASVLVVVFLLIRPLLFQSFYIPSGSMEPTLMGPERGSIGDRLIADKLIYRLGDPRRLDIVVFKSPPAAMADEKDFIKRVIGLPGETVEVVPPRLLVDGRAVCSMGTEGGGLRLPVGGTHPTLESGGRVATFGSGSESLRVLAGHDWQVDADEHLVQVNGVTELQDFGGRIVRSASLVPFGGDAVLRATVFSVLGEPRLLLVEGDRLSGDTGYVLVNGRRLVEPYIKEPPTYAMAPVRLGPHEYFMMGDNRNNSRDSHAWGPLERARVIGRAELIFWPLGRIHVLRWWLLALSGGLLLGYYGVRAALQAASRTETSFP